MGLSSLKYESRRRRCVTYLCSRAGSEFLQDLSVYISDTIKDFHWRWDVMSVCQMAGTILSKQLFMPLVTLATITSSLGSAIENASEETLQTVGRFCHLWRLISPF
jgi:hypothetical protein